VTGNATEAIIRGPQTLGELAELVGDRGHTSNQRRWDRLVDQWLADRSVLAGSDEGRAVINALMDDPRPAVRLWSAGAVLFWDPDAARTTLTEIRNEPSRYDLLSITAKHTMMEFEAGTLEEGTRLPGT
jgi:hypothetical protein